jgi:hypothetical protein
MRPKRRERHPDDGAAFGDGVAGIPRKLGSSFRVRACPVEVADEIIEIPAGAMHRDASGRRHLRAEVRRGLLRLVVERDRLAGREVRRGFLRGLQAVGHRLRPRFRLTEVVREHGDVIREAVGIERLDRGADRAVEVFALTQ